MTNVPPWTAARGHDIAPVMPDVLPTTPVLADDVLPAAPTPLDPRALSVQRTATLLGAPIVLVVATAIARVALDLPWPMAVGAGAAVAVLIGAVEWWLDGVRHRRWRWHVDDVAIVLARGGIVRTETTIPRFRLQHVDVSQGPLERRHGVATLTLHVAGSDAEHELPGLDAAWAAAVREALVRTLHARWVAETVAAAEATDAGDVAHVPASGAAPAAGEAAAP